MNSKKVIVVYSILFTLFFCSVGYSQRIIKGTVIDSTSLAPLPYVSIKVKNFDRGAITDEFGNFSVKATMFDTLVFSSVGYVTREVHVKNSDEAQLIRLEEIINMLKGVTIHDRIELAGVGPLPKEKVFVNSAATRAEYGQIQTFGVGYVLKGPFSFFSKSEKEKRKLAETRVDNSKARTYVEVVSSPEVKDSIMHKYAITERQYYDMLAQFNKANPKSIGLEPKSLIFSIFHFYDAEIKKQKTPAKRK